MSRIARDDEIDAWWENGWVVLEGLVDTDTIDAAMPDLWHVFPKPDKFHEDPARYIPAGKSTQELRRGYPELPEHGPSFRPEQHRWGHEFPFMGTGALNRLFVHPSIVDFAQRALGTTEVRCYQAQVSAKYAGDADYEQPMHTDMNHSYVGTTTGPPWWHVEGFLYLSDVDDDTMPTHFVDRRDAAGRSPNRMYRPERDPELYAHERPATGVRGSLLVYRNNTFHRAVNMTRPRGSRFLLNVSYRNAGVEWIGYHTSQSKASHPGWTQFVEQSTPEELQLFGFPPPGHPVWTQELINATTEKYPNLDVSPWRDALPR